MTISEGTMIKQWYIVHTYSGFEGKVKESLKQRAEAAGMAEVIEEILIPTEEVVEIRDGKKTKSTRKFFPGLPESREPPRLDSLSARAPLCPLHL